MQLSRGESLQDTARVFSRHVAAFGVRITAHAALEELAAASDVPVFNMLTALHHPCQALADLMTMREALRARRRAADRLRRRRQQRRPLARDAGHARRASTSRSPRRPATRWPTARSRGCSSRTTRARPSPARTSSTRTCGSAWATSDDRRRTAARRSRRYRLDDALLDAAAPGAIALHCLPAHPGEEITAEVLYGDRAAHLGPGREPPARAEGAARVAVWPRSRH